MSGKGVTYKKQARKMIFHVYNFLKADAQENNIKLTVKELEHKTAEATKSSVSTVWRVMKDARDNNYSAANFVTPGKKRPRANKVLNFTLLELGQIKRIIHNFHVTENEMLTMERLRRKLANTMDYKGSWNGLRRTAKGLGFRSKKVEGGSGRHLHIEKSDIRLQRIEYLQKLRNYRQEGRKLVYIHHVFIEPVPPENKKPTVKLYMCVLSASTDSIIIPDTVFAFATSKTEYDEHFYNEYVKWITECLIMNIDENSVVVIGSEKCHDKEYDVTPTSYGKRTEIIAWLEEKGIEFDHSWLKPQLYALIKKYTDLNKEFLIDKLLAEHTILRIPLCHPDLNPLQIAWEDIKSYVRNKEMLFKKENVTEAAKERIAAMSTEFKNLCRQVKDIEQEYRKSDYVIDMLTEEYKVYAGQSSDQDDCDEDDEPDDTGDDDDEVVEVKKERLE